MFDSSLSVIIFRLINVAVLIGLGFYLFKKYVKNKIDEKITNKEALLKGLEEQGYFLEGKAHNLEDQLQMQEKKAVALQRKIDEWSSRVAAEKSKYAEEYKVNAARIAERTLIKNKNIAQQQWRMSIVPQALDEARTVLVQEFFDASRAQRYAHDIAQYLERE